MTPVHGIVPVGGSAQLQLSLTPDSVVKFDCRIQVAIKGGKIIELRTGGTVEIPQVDIDAVSEAINLTNMVYCFCVWKCCFSHKFRPLLAL